MTSVIICATGPVYTQRLRGLLNSGSKVTSQSGSGMRALISTLCNQICACVTCGDDCAEVTKYSESEFSERMMSLGYRVKGVQESPDLIFCGYYRDIIKPEKPYKALANYLQSMGTKDGKQHERMFALIYELRFCPFKDDLLSYVKSVSSVEDKVQINYLSDSVPEIIGLMKSFVMSDPPETDGLKKIPFRNYGEFLYEDDATNALATLDLSGEDIEADR